MKIPFFPYSKLYLSQREEFIKIFDDVCSRGAYILQKDLENLESNLASYLNIKHVYGVANGTDALIIGLKASNIGSGDEVIMPSHTYIASAASVHLVGAEPILCECGEDGMMDPYDIEHRITNRTKAIMPVHINGRTCDMDKIEAIASENNLMIVEDAAQGLGSKFGERFAGTFGSFGTISFYPAKLLGCFGDGGLIMTNDDGLSEKISLLRDHGRDKNGIVVDWGLNSRLDNLQAAFLLFKLESYNTDISRRRELAKIYNNGLSDLDDITLPMPPTDGKNFDVYQNYELRAKDRDNLMNHLQANGIGSIIQWAGTPVHKFTELGFNQSLPRTEKFFEECIMIPMNVSVTDIEAEYIIDKIRGFYE